MTNPTPFDLSSELTPALRALATAGTAWRPVKVVEHPTFRAARARRDAGLTDGHRHVTALIGALAASPDACACPGANLDPSKEAA